MNLVSTILQFLAPAIINKLAGSLGIGQGLAGKAIAAAIPAILAGLAGSSAKPGGAAALSNLLGKQDPGMLGNFASMIGGAGQKSMAEGGMGALSSLLGGSSTNALAGAVGKFAGIDANQSSGLLGMLAPVVMGQLAQTQKSSGLDAGGLASLLAGQKDNIAAAMPGGFADMLGGSGLLDSIGGNLKSAATHAAAPVAHATEEASSGFGKWIVPLVLAVVGAYLLNSYGCQRAVEKVQAPVAPVTKQVTAPVAPAAVVPADLAGLTSKALGALTSSLGGIKDEASAKAALPGLGDVAKQIDGVKTAAALLSGDARKPIASMIAAALPGITASVEKAVGIPGVGALINPVLGPMVANLGDLAK